MAISEERLIAVLEARIADYEKNLAKALKGTNKQFTAIEKRGKDMEAKLAAIGKGAGDKFSRGLSTALGGLSAVLSVREVAQYADSWTSAKNSLAVAGVTGEQQKAILDQLFNSAQKNAAPIGALADLYGRAAQSADVLGASQQDLVKFSDAVALGLKVGGTSAEAASGALQQLGQALGSGNVQAEEFNSIMDGTPAIAKAAAAGIKEADGSVAKLKQLVNDGKISSQNLFQGILVGSKRLEEMASNSTQTIAQGFTKINNALTRYIGQTDEGLGASQRLVAGLNSLADNFDATADKALQLAAVIAGALVGRGIGAMLSQVPQLVAALGTLITALRTGVALAPALGLTLGPLGAVAGAAAAAIYLLYDAETDAQKAEKAHEATVKTLTSEIQNLDYANDQAVASTRTKIEGDIEAAKAALQRAKAERSLAASMVQEEVSPSMSLLPAPAASDVSNTVNNNGIVKDRQALIDALDNQLKDLETINAKFQAYAAGKEKPTPNTSSSTVSTGAVDGAVSANGTGGKNGSKKAKLDEYERMTKRIEEATAATEAETAAQSKLNPLIDDFGFAASKARAQFELLNAAKEAGVKITPELEKQVDQLSTSYANAGVQAEKLSQSQDKARQSAQQLKADAKDVLSGVVSDLRAGASAADLFANAINKLADKIIDNLLDSILQINGAGGSGSFFASLFGGASSNSITSSGFKTNTTLGSFLGLKDGGDVDPEGLVRGPGGPRGDKIPTMLSDGEYVVNAAATKRNRALLEAINNRKHFQHRANGGIVSNRSSILSQPPKTLDVAKVAASRSSPVQISFNPTIDNRGASVDAVARNEQALAQLQKTLPAQVVNAIRDARARGVKV